MTRAMTVSVLLLSTAASGQTLMGFKILNNESDPFKYYVDSRDNISRGVTVAQVQTAAKNAFQTWQDVACASTAFQYVGAATGIANPKDPYDAFSVTGNWVTSKADEYYETALGGGVATMAALILSYDGIAQYCDVYVNGIDFKWSVSSTVPADAYDLQSVFLHEHGHCQGLGHTSISADVMYTRAKLGGAKRTLTSNDRNTVCGLYPVTGVVGSPCKAAEPKCDGSGYKCVSPANPSGGTYPAMCTRGCTLGASDCPEPYQCVASTLISGSNAICVPPAEETPNIGAPCEWNGDCTSGKAVCILANNPQLPSGASNWRGGYCSQDCGAGGSACPSGSSCIDTHEGKLCLDNCSVDNNDCRFGYSCARPDPSKSAVCVPACGADIDCVAGHVCRPCDGLCVARQDPSAQVGDSCNSNSECGTGGVCLRFTNSEAGICSQACGSACSVCPSGSACHPVGQNGEQYCLKTCSVGTCPEGLQCGQLETGTGCMPTCASDDECPVGNQCIAGQCLDPNVEECTICGSNGGIVRLPDGGYGTVGDLPNGGCGCRGSGPEALLWVAGLILFPVLRRRRRLN